MYQDFEEIYLSLKQTPAVLCIFQHPVYVDFHT